MKESTTFSIVYGVLILTLVALLGWWAYDKYRPRPTPLQMSSEQSMELQPRGDYIQPEPAGVKDTPQVDPTLKALFPFQTTPIENGFKIGAITITLNDLLDTFSTLSYNTSRDISDFELWQDAAELRSRQAVILDEAVKRGYKLTTDSESQHFDQEIIDSATSFLSTNLETANNGTTLDSLISARGSDYLVLQVK